MYKKYHSVLLAMLVGLVGCAGNPPISELRKEVKSVSFVQHGKRPLSMGFGVVDTASFWANAGSDVALRTGGLMWHAVGAAAQAETDRKAPAAADVMKHLYNDHPMANQALEAVMPALAHAWGVPFDPKQVHVLDADQVFEDKDGYLVGISPTTDLVLAAWVNKLVLTEKISLGGALAAGFTMGMNTKKVTAESYLWMRAYRKEEATGRYKQAWVNGCGVLNMNMAVSYPFPEVMTSPEKAKEIWDDAAPKLIENCKAVLRQVALEG